MDGIGFIGIILLFIILIVAHYFSWINSSIKEMKQKLSNIEELLKNEKK